MKVEIKNFGPIDFLVFDLEKDLHLIYGKNAIGKSYATYCLYCLIKNIKNKAIRNYSYSPQPNSNFTAFVSTILKQLKKDKKNQVIQDGLKKTLEKDLSDIILKNLQNSIQITFSSLKNLKNAYSNKDFEISIILKDKRKLRFCLKDENDLRLDFQATYTTLELIEKDTKSTRFSIYQAGKKMIGKPTEEEFINEFQRIYIGHLNAILTELDFNLRDIYYLPASRSGLYQALNAFTPIVAELTQNRFFLQNRNIELPSLPEPLSDYFIDLSTVDVNNVNAEFEPIYSIIESDILQGAVSFDEKTKKISYKPKNLQIELNLSESSSMVSELSPLVLYLKHILNHKFQPNRERDYFFYDSYYSSRNKKERGYDVIFIEEPEAHLHPEVQISLIEIFSKLTSYKLKIFITSHSNYMFNKLNNIIIKKEIDIKKLSVYHLVKSENGTKQQNDMPITLDGIIDENFQEVSEQLYYERMNSFENNAVED